MVQYDILRTHCTLDNGYVVDYDGCTSRCSYICISPYEKAQFTEYVDCYQTSGKWMTADGGQPCVIDAIKTTTEMPDFQLPDFKIPTENIPVFQPHDSDTKSYDFESNVDHHDSDMNDAAIFGLIIGSIVGFMILVVCLRICIARSVARRRQQRMVQLAEQLNVRSRQQRSTRASTGTGSERENTEEGGILILRIRRYFCIPVLRNPYRAFRNPPEPPPYDAESVPPPAYEETERLDGSAPDTRPQTAGNFHTETAETPAEPPPPYTANIV